MFEFFFRYPSTVFSKGQFVLLGAWPAWVLGVLAIFSAVVVAAVLRRRSGNRPFAQSAVL